MKILVAYDGSAEARNALSWAGQLARGQGEHTVTVIGVVPTLEATEPIADAVDPSSGAAKVRIHLAEAEKENKNALKAKPDFGQAHSNLAVIYMMGGRVACRTGG